MRRESAHTSACSANVNFARRDACNRCQAPRGGPDASSDVRTPAADESAVPASTLSDDAPVGRGRGEPRDDVEPPRGRGRGGPTPKPGKPGDWLCPNVECGLRRGTCAETERRSQRELGQPRGVQQVVRRLRCVHVLSACSGVPRPRGAIPKVAMVIGEDAAAQSKGLFNPNDWQCSSYVLYRGAR